ncbi:phage portal protein [Ferruginivarius sediminum]|uniref:phage portal protein n=1 Tax=Ferruginivarius sediminum TaxID=2661937 RepID=UPI0019D49E7A|nr:phage portal protein [Ferruginivarius sediminum]
MANKVSIPRRGRVVSYKTPVRISAQAYQGAGTGRRAKTWNPSRASINTILTGDLDRLRARTRDAVRNNPHAAAAREALVSNMVGTGIVPRTLSQVEARREALRLAFADWIEEADADGRCDFFGLQGMVAGGLFDGGEILVRRRRRRQRDGLSVPLQLQLIEPEHLDATFNRDLERGRTIRNGVEFDAIGRRRAYWLWRGHPGEWQTSADAARRVRVPARDIAHIFNPLRPGQIRGVPWPATVLTRLYEIDQYDDAELVRKKTAALFAAFVQKRTGDGATGSAAEAFGGVGDPPVEADELDIVLEPGTTQLVPDGYEMKFSEPADVGANYEVWIKQQLRTVAAGMGVTYEQLTGDLSDVNYSSIRAGLLEFRRRVEAWQHNVLVFQFCRVAWRWFAEAAVQAGVVPARGFAEDRRDFLRAKWIPQGWTWVDPEKEIKAVVMAIRAGIISRADAIAEFGYDAEEIDREVAAETARVERMGLVLDSIPKQTDQSGKMQRTPQQREANDGRES